MKIGTANIKNYPDMPAAKVKQDGSKMASLTDIWGMQENNPAEDDDAIDSVLGNSWDVAHRSTNVPLWFRKDQYQVLGTRICRAPMEKDLKLVPKPRLFTGTTLKLRLREGVPSFVVVNVHFIAGGYNGPENPERRQQWNVEWKYVCDFIADYKRKGKTVFVLGDFNHPRPPKPARNFTWLVGSRLDRIGVTTTGQVEVEELSDGVVALNSDHNGQWTRVVLSKK